MTGPSGFSHEVRSSGEIVVRHGDRIAATLRGARAAEFLADMAVGDEQELMARVTGNYRHGNERQARDHPRNQR